MWKNNSLINLHLLTGQIGKPGAGPFSLTGQPNAMGGREVGLLAQSAAGLPVHRGPGASRRGRGVLETPRRGRSPTQAGPDGRRDVPRPRIGPAQGDLDRGDQPRRQPARPAPRPPRPGQGRAGRRPGRLPPDRDDPVRRRPAAGRPVVREGVDQHQQRAARLAAASRSSTRPAWPCPTGRSSPDSARAMGFDGLRVQGRRRRSGTSSSR